LFGEKAGIVDDGPVAEGIGFHDVRVTAFDVAALHRHRRIIDLDDFEFAVTGTTGTIFWIHTHERHLLFVVIRKNDSQTALVPDRTSNDTLPESSRWRNVEFFPHSV